MAVALDRSPWRAARRAFALVLALAACPGCLVDARLAAGGGGALTLGYRLDDRGTLGAAAERLASPSVTVRSARVDAQRNGTFKVTFADIQALSTTAMFKQVSITRGPGKEAGTTTLVATFEQAKPLTLPPEVLQRQGNELTVVLRLPGAIVDTNASTHRDEIATWVVPLKTLLGGGKTTFSVTYRDPAAGRAAGSA
jgi:hypothetical protein